MIPEYVIDIKPRKSDVPERFVSLPRITEPPKLFSPEYWDWWEENEWLINFTVHVSNLALVKELANELGIACKENNKKKIESLIEQLRPLRVLPFDERTLLEKWAHMMRQLPDDIGGPNKEKIRAILSARCKGRVLEAMCGFNSYLEPSEKIEVTALDFCREALELYHHPERTRILFDLNKITRRKGIGFFQEGEFDAITICFGFHYIRHPIIVFQEFKRLLSVGGRLIFIENPNQCYSDMIYRCFLPENCVSCLKKASFESVQVEELAIAEDWEIEAGGHYFLIEAFKS